MAQFASDTFAGTTGDTLQTYSASWVLHPSYTSSALIASGRVRGPNDGSNTAYYHSGTPVSADYSVSADIYCQTNTNGKPAVFGRLSTSANTGYHARFWAGTGWQLYKVTAGTFTQLGTSVGQTLTAGNTYNLKLEMVGSTIKLYADGVLKISVTDTAITAAGKAGLSFRDAITSSDTTLLHLDNFSADDIGGTAYTLTADPGSFAATGTAANLKYNRVLAADAGAFAVTGTAATLRRGYRLQADPGSFGITGTAATLKYNRVIAASAGSFQVSGTGASLRYNRVLAAAPGAFQITGTDATLTYGAAGSYTLVASPGSFGITGTDATLRYGRRLAADSGSFAFAGSAATLRYARRVIAESGVFGITGAASSLRYARILSAEPGALSLTGTAATLTLSSGIPSVDGPAGSGPRLRMPHGHRPAMRNTSRPSQLR